MGRSYAVKGNFLTPEATRFVGPEKFPWLIRQLIMLSFRLIGNSLNSRCDIPIFYLFQRKILIFVCVFNIFY